MKKFVLMSVGFEMPTPQVQQAWMSWFGSIADRMVDSGSPLGPGREVTKNGTKELGHGLDAVTGYTVIKAESLDEAEAIAKTCPIVTGMRVYEAMQM